jgi:hypothetical protein
MPNRPTATRCARIAPPSAIRPPLQHCTLRRDVRPPSLTVNRRRRTARRTSCALRPPDSVGAVDTRMELAQERPSTTGVSLRRLATYTDGHGSGRGGPGADRCGAACVDRGSGRGALTKPSEVTARPSAGSSRSQELGSKDRASTPPRRTSRSWQRVGLGYKSPLRHSYTVFPLLRHAMPRWCGAPVGMKLVWCRLVEPGSSLVP